MFTLLTVLIIPVVLVVYAIYRWADVGSYEDNTHTTCWLLGHKFSPETDECDKCGMPIGWYYAQPNTGPELLRTTRWFFLTNWYIIENKLATRFIRCSDCGKPEYVFGKRVGNHQGCLPF